MSDVAEIVRVHGGSVRRSGLAYLAPFSNRTFGTFRFGFGDKHAMTDGADSVSVVLALPANLESLVEYFFVLYVGDFVEEPVPPSLYNIFDRNHI